MLLAECFKRLTRCFQLVILIGKQLFVAGQLILGFGFFFLRLLKLFICIGKLYSLRLCFCRGIFCGSCKLLLTL